MIALLQGLVVSKQLNSVIISAGGVGFQCYTTVETISELHEGAQATLHTYLLVRPEALTLYGFKHVDERRTFEILLTAQGVGAKLALAMLNTFSAQDLAMAIADKDYKKLCLIPGIGRRTAEKLVLELNGKLGRPSASSVNNGEGFDRAEVEAALVQLGWPAKNASEALKDNQAPDSATALRQALLVLGGSRK